MALVDEKTIGLDHPKVAKLVGGAVKDTLKAHVAAIKETIDAKVEEASNSGDKLLSRTLKAIGADTVRNVKALHKEG